MTTSMASSDKTKNVTVTMRDTKPKSKTRSGGCDPFWVFLLGDYSDKEDSDNEESKQNGELQAQYDSDSAGDSAYDDNSAVSWGNVDERKSTVGPIAFQTESERQSYLLWKKKRYQAVNDSFDEETMTTHGSKCDQSHLSRSKKTSQAVNESFDDETIATYGSKYDDASHSRYTAETYDDASRTVESRNGNSDDSSDEADAATYHPVWFCFKTPLSSTVQLARFPHERAKRREKSDSSNRSGGNSSLVSSLDRRKRREDSSNRDREGRDESLGQQKGRKESKDERNFNRKAESSENGNKSRSRKDSGEATSASKPPRVSKRVTTRADKHTITSKDESRKGVKAESKERTKKTKDTADRKAESSKGVKAESKERTKKTKDTADRKAESSKGVKAESKERTKKTKDTADRKAESSKGVKAESKERTEKTKNNVDKKAKSSKGVKAESKERTKKNEDNVDKKAESSKGVKAESKERTEKTKDHVDKKAESSKGVKAESKERTEKTKERNPLKSRSTEKDFESVDEIAKENKVNDVPTKNNKLPMIDGLDWDWDIPIVENQVLPMLGQDPFVARRDPPASAALIMGLPTPTKAVQASSQKSSSLHSAGSIQIQMNNQTNIEQAQLQKTEESSDADRRSSIHSGPKEPSDPKDEDAVQLESRGEPSDSMGKYDSEEEEKSAPQSHSEPSETESVSRSPTKIPGHKSSSTDRKTALSKGAAEVSAQHQPDLNEGAPEEKVEERTSPTRIGKHDVPARSEKSDDERLENRGPINSSEKQEKGNTETASETDKKTALWKANLFNRVRSIEGNKSAPQSHSEPSENESLSRPSRPPKIPGHKSPVQSSSIDGEKSAPQSHSGPSENESLSSRPPKIPGHKSPVQSSSIDGEKSAPQSHSGPSENESLSRRPPKIPGHKSPFQSTSINRKTAVRKGAAEVSAQHPLNERTPEEKLEERTYPTRIDTPAPARSEKSDDERLENRAPIGSEKQEKGNTETASETDKKAALWKTNLFNRARNSDDSSIVSVDVISRRSFSRRRDLNTETSSVC
jgi:hypothetical protein